jgi:hypothetical protein
MARAEILKELNQIAEIDGTLRPEAVVAFAKNPKTELHHCFTWDNTKAAHQWRLHEARMIIRVSVTIISDDADECRAFVSLKSDRHAGIGYRSMISILDDEELRELMLQDALEEMQTFKEKYKDLKELCEVFDAMDKIIVKKPRKQSRPRAAASMMA